MTWQTAITVYSRHGSAVRETTHPQRRLAIVACLHRGQAVLGLRQSRRQSGIAVCSLHGSVVQAVSVVRQLLATLVCLRSGPVVRQTRGSLHQHPIDAGQRESFCLDNSATVIRDNED